LLATAILAPSAIHLYHYEDPETENKGRRPQPPICQEIKVAQNHYSSKTKRRPKSGKRKDSSAETMAALRKREAAEKK
jgi:hypothetical protein